MIIRIPINTEGLNKSRSVPKSNVPLALARTTTLSVMNPSIDNWAPAP